MLESFSEGKRKIMPEKARPPRRACARQGGERILVKIRPAKIWLFLKNQYEYRISFVTAKERFLYC